MRRLKYTITIKQTQMFPARIVILSSEELSTDHLRDQAIGHLKNNFCFDIQKEEGSWVYQKDDVTLD